MERGLKGGGREERLKGSNRKREEGCGGVKEGKRAGGGMIS